MLTFEIFLLGLLIASTLTGLATEAVKKTLTDVNVTIPANILAGIVALVLAAALGLCYLLLAAIPFDARSVVYLLALVFMSWLCAMVGYDKVVQALGQLRGR